mgnify:CR=1 FL=1
MIPGLVSVSFRTLSVKEVLQLCQKARLKAIEWGGDVHVPAGEVEMAKKVLAMSLDSGITVVSYGSYYRLGQSIDEFKKNLETAMELEAPVLRVWAGNKGSKQCSSEERTAWVEQLAKVSEMGRQAGIIVAPEFHIHTLTDTLWSVKQLLRELPEQKFYWQPRWDWPEEIQLDVLELIGPRLTYMHTFTWRIENGKEIRLPLAKGEKLWKQALRRGMTDYALLEFVRNDDPSMLLEDAETLRSWL